MKKSVFYLIAVIITLSASMASAANTNLKSASDMPAVPVKTENKLTDEEMSSLTLRVEEIRSMDKTDMTVTEKRELRKELREIKENVKRNNGTIVIGSTTLILVIILIILLV